MAKARTPKRGAIWRVQFDPSVDSGADAFQVKSVSESRFVARVGFVTDAQADEIASAVALCVDAP